MPREFKRSDRVADAIQRSLSQIIQMEVRDPRLGMVNINAVNVTQDLSLAKVYVTFVGQRGSVEEEEKKVEVLNNASSFIRSLLAKDVKLRITPRLAFVYDKTVVHSQEMSALIDRAVSADNAAHKVQSDDQDGSDQESQD